MKNQFDIVLSVQFSPEELEIFKTTHGRDMTEQDAEDLITLCMTRATQIDGFEKLIKNL